MLRQRAALDLALEIWNGPRRVEMPRLDRIDAAMRVPEPFDRGLAARVGGSTRYMGDFATSVSIPDDAPPVVFELARKSQTNYLQLLVRVFRQSLRVEGYLTSAPAEENPWRWWQANRLDARQVGLHDTALKYGGSYLRVLPGDEGPSARAFSPRNMTAVYADPEFDEWPLFSLHVEGSHLVLTDEECEYRFGIEDASTAAARTVRPAMSASLGTRQLTFIESRVHDVGFCPAVRYRDECLVAGEEQYGIVEPLLVIQERIDETNFGQLVAQYFGAFKQRAVLGWVPESEAEELKAGASRIWYLDVDKNEVDIKELSETDLTRYIDSGKSARKDFAAIAQIPAGDMGVDSISNISDATLAGLDKSKNERAGEIALSLGESHEQALRLMARLAGDEAAATDWNSEVRWAEREARTWAGQIDGLVKLVQSQILAQDTAVTMVPGLTEQQVEMARADARKARAAATVASLRGQGGAAAQ